MEIENKEPEVVIDDKNFSEYFYDVRTTGRPQPGQIMACYTASAELTEGPEKQNLLNLLRQTDKAVAITQVMRKLLNASERDAIRIPREIAQDMLFGLTYEQVLKKSYKYTFEMYFYTRPEFIPKDDPHWSTISLINVNGLLENINMVEELAKEG